MADDTPTTPPEPPTPDDEARELFAGMTEDMPGALRAMHHYPTASEADRRALDSLKLTAHLFNELLNGPADDDDEEDDEVDC